MIRCYNCGLEGHKTQVCPSYGPHYPEPGKTREDYKELSQRIANRFAADIIQEHEVHEDGIIPKKPPKYANVRPGTSDRERILRSFVCGFCGAEPGAKCTSVNGKSHKNRWHQAIESGRLEVKV